jgi:hypothetical protein
MSTLAEAAEAWATFGDDVIIGTEGQDLITR